MTRQRPASISPSSSRSSAAPSSPALGDRRRWQRRANTRPRSMTAARAALGAKALDDLTLQLDLTNPAPYFHTIASPGSSSRSRRRSWRKTRTTGGRRPRTTSATDRSRSPASTRTSSGHSPPMTTTGRAARSSTASSIVYVEDAAVALEAYRTGDLDIVQLEAHADPGGAGRSRALQSTS